MFSTRTSPARSSLSPHTSRPPIPPLTPPRSTRTCGQAGSMSYECSRGARGSVTAARWGADGPSRVRAAGGTHWSRCPSACAHVCRCEMWPRAQGPGRLGLRVGPPCVTPGLVGRTMSPCMGQDSQVVNASYFLLRPTDGSIAFDPLTNSKQASAGVVLPRNALKMGKQWCVLASTSPWAPSA